MLDFVPTLAFFKSLRGSSRDVAQPGRAPRSGRGGRWFKSSRPDHV
jgi:hypothetical protein